MGFGRLLHVMPFNKKQKNTHGKESEEKLRVSAAHRGDVPHGTGLRQQRHGARWISQSDLSGRKRQ